MKKRILILSAIAGISVLTLSSYRSGPASEANGLNLTGAQGSSITCGGGGCHGGTSANTSVTITLDSAGTSVSSYKAGVTYTVNITGSNTSSLPDFGFQFASVNGIGNAQAQAGTFSGLPNQTHTHTAGVALTVVEHSAPLPGTSGHYAVSFQWTAPAAGTGTVTMYCTLNAVIGNPNSPDPQDLCHNTHITLTEQTGGVGVSSIPADVDIIAYPNPVSGQLNLKMENASTGVYAMSIYDITGKRIITDNLNVSSASFATTVNTANLVPGYYSILLIKDGAQRIIPVVKQ